MRYSDYILSSGAGALAVSADTAFSDKFTVCIVLDAPDDLLYALLDALKSNPYVMAVLLYARHPDSGGIKRLAEYAGRNAEKIKLFCYGDEDAEKDILARGAYTRPTYAQALNILVARAESRKLFFLEPRSALGADTVRAMHEAMTTSAQRESGIFFPEIEGIKAQALMTPERLLVENGLGLKPKNALARWLVGSRSAYSASLHERACLPVYCFAMSQRYFWRLGGFDARLKKPAALQDFCLSVCESGGDIARCPQASMVCYADADTAKFGARRYAFKDILRIFDSRFRGMYRPGVAFSAALLYALRRRSA